MVPERFQGHTVANLLEHKLWFGVFGSETKYLVMLTISQRALKVIVQHLFFVFDPLGFVPTWLKPHSDELRLKHAAAVKGCGVQKIEKVLFFALQQSTKAA